MQTLHLNIPYGDPPSFHPHLNGGHLPWRCLGRLLYESLTRLNAKGEAEPSGAESIQTSPDLMHYTFTLRDAIWSDGTPVTAFQYESAWKQAMSKNSPCTRSEMFYMIKNAKEIKKGLLPVAEAGVKAINSKTLVVDLAFPCPYFLKALAEPLFAPIENANETPKKFNGPFVLHRWDQGHQLVLKKNPAFWNEKKVQLDEINMSFAADIDTAYRLFEEGKLDWIGLLFCSIPMEAIPELKRSGKLRTDETFRVCWVHLNTDSPFLSSRPIRQALSLALNRDEIHQHILDGQPIYSPLPVGFSSSSKTHSQDLQKARKLFEAGLKELGLSKETLPPLQLRSFSNARMKLLALYLQQAWQKAFGIEVQLEYSDWNAFRKALETGDFQIGGCFETPLYQDPLAFLEPFDLAALPNYTKWTSSAYQEKIASSKLTSDPKERKELLREAEEILAHELPVIPISNDVDQFAHHPALKGYVLDHSGHVDFSYAYFDR